MGNTTPAIAAALAVVSLSLLATPAGAHSKHTRGQIVQEETVAVPAPAGYAAPEPKSLGGAFELIDHTGRDVSDKTFRGQTMLVFFGYAGCREACPLGLDNMARALELMGPEADKIQPLFVDIDLAGPDLKGLSQFVGNFHPRLIGLTGSRKQMYHMLRIFKVRREYGMAAYGKKETGPRIDHTTYVFVVGPDGVTRNYFYHNLPPEQMVTLIRKEL